VAGTVAASACGDSKRPSGAPPSSTGGKTANGGRAGSSSSTSGHDAGGSPDAGAGGDSTVSHAGSNAAGTATTEGGAAGDTSVVGSMGGMPDPIPPEGDPPLCTPGASYAAGTLVSLSKDGDDLLQAITPDELTIAWKNGADYFIADRADAGAAFGNPLKVVGGSAFLAISLRFDGRQLLAITDALSVVQMVRQEGEAFDAGSASAGDFDDFNHTLNSSPEPGKVFTDAVLSADDKSFFYSYFLSGDGSSPATLRESHRDGTVWSFSGVQLGSLLEGSAAKRRIPTGVSSDKLTLFYRDEVSADFRAAWRVNTQVQFNHAEALALGTGTKAAAPNAACTKLYFSAQGQSDLDLFVSEKN
jgi:hypothetical protein